MWNKKQGYLGASQTAETISNLTNFLIPTDNCTFYLSPKKLALQQTETFNESFILSEFRERIMGCPVPIDTHTTHPYKLGSEHIVEMDFRRLYRPKDQYSTSVLKQFFFLCVIRELNQGISTMWLLTQDLRRYNIS